MYIQKSIQVYIFIATLLGLIVFFRGYFIDRRYLLTQSEPISRPSEQIIFVVIDSLRSDLAISQHFPFIKNKLETQPSQAVFFVAIGEVPTVTGPRVQAMTSGNFPPLSKLLDNFHASEIVEDNLLFQLNKANKKSFFTGDHVWMGLYPNDFTVSYPQNSFNIQDTDTVDNFNMKKLLEVMNQDYDFIVAHFLGLDHAGHRNDRVFNNPELDQSLSDLNYMMEQIYNHMNPYSIMIIAGDHGMADDGNHGGNSTEETNTIFFALRKTGQFQPQYMNQLPELIQKPKGLIDSKEYTRIINQVDIVPTLAKLLGIAIPYSNLGTIIPEIVNNDQDCVENLQQVLIYVNDVHSKQSKFTSKQITYWNSQEDLKTCVQILPLLQEIQYAAQAIWKEYEYPLLIMSFVFQFTLLAQFIVFILLLQQPNFDGSKVLDIQFYELTQQYKFPILSFIGVNILLSIWIDYAYFVILYSIIVGFIVLGYTSILLKRTLNEQKILEYSNLLQAQQVIIEENNKYSYEIWVLNGIFCYKIILQVLLLLSTEKKRNELKYLKIDIKQVILLVFIFNIGHLFLNRYVRNQPQKLLSILLNIIYYLAIAGLLYSTIRIQAKYENNYNTPTRWHKSILQYYVPSIILQIFLFIYSRKYVHWERIYQHSMLLLIQFFHIHQKEDMETSYFEVTVIPRIVYLMALMYFKNKSILYLFFICLMVSDINGLAIYAYFFIILQMIYLLCKKQLKQKYYLVFVSIITLITQYTWFLLGNRCTISSVKLDRAFIGLTQFSIIFCPLILATYLIGPFVGSLTFLQYIYKQICEKFDEVTRQAVVRQIKLIFQLNFFIQILITQIHSYLNAGGIIEIQFKYMFDVVSYIVVLLLVQII